MLADKPLLLCFDSSTIVGSVALVSGPTIIAQVMLQSSQRSHSDYLLRYAQLILDESGYALADIDGLVVVAGPGSFTGLRVGLATVQGLAQALQLPIYPVSSLQTVAFANGCIKMPVQVLIDARKHEVYTACYQWIDSVPCLQGTEQVVAPQILLAQIKKRTLFVGNGVGLYRDLVVTTLPDLALISGDVNQFPSAGNAGLLTVALGTNASVVNEFELRPAYVRKSDAELQKQK
jgi:tRNA threonylcarbamoyladenosine biosynthesis protein TsaB